MSEDETSGEPQEFAQPRDDHHEAAPLAIVGVGCSVAKAGAVARFFGRSPSDAGLAYVVVCQAPNELDVEALGDAIRQATDMPVLRATDGERPAPNRIYLAPAASKTSLADFRFAVEPATGAPGERGAIDTFLVALSEAFDARAVGVIFSELGSDGVLGSAALKEAGGLAMMESDGEEGAGEQPRTPVGIADFVLSAEEMAERVVEHARHLNEVGDALKSEELDEVADSHIPKIAAILRNRTGHDFHGYKSNTFMRRVQRRMNVTRIGKIDAYVERLRSDADEVDHLFQDLLIGVTQFFRDPSEFDAVASIVIPAIFAGRGPEESIRVWVLGCATGEEAYSLGILIREHMATLDVVPHVQIFATDIDNRALAVARTGRYPASIAEDISPERLARWFVREGDTYAVQKELREMCLFSGHNIIKDAPFSRIDLISCRNLLIYLNSELQARVIPLFHFALKPGGYLFLGPSENVTRHTKLFAPVDRRHRVFKRQETLQRVLPEFPLTARVDASRAAPPMLRPRPNENLGRRAERIAERYAPAYVIVDAHYEILHFSGRTGRYLDPASGSANLNLLNLVHRDLRIDLRAALQKVEAEGGSVKIDNLRVGSNGETRLVNLVVETDDAAAWGTKVFVVIFQDGGAFEPRNGEDAESSNLRGEHVQRLEEELRLTKERLQATIEELETTNEELKSSNEEYQSINEELQSANEELETSKEELQSVNEELQTVNGELAHRVTELARANSDLKNLLESTQIATIFLDNDLRVRSFTPTATDIFYFVESDTGRPLAHIKTQLVYPQLQDDARKVIRSLKPIEREVASEKDDAVYLVRLLPYRSVDNYIAGAVLTFLDITAATRAEQALRDSEARYKLILDSLTDYALIAGHGDGKVVTWNVGAENIFGWTAAEMVGRNADIIFTAEDRAAGVPKREMETAAAKGEAADERWHVRNDGSRFWGSGKMFPMNSGAQSGFLKVLHDRTEARNTDERQKLLLGELQHRVRNIISVVRSLAARTLETSNSMKEFGEAFSGRLETLGRTQNILTRTDDVSIGLLDLIRDELTSVGSPESDRVALSGPPTRLRRKAAEAIALAIHELATNASKYGAFAHPTGRLEVGWRHLNTHGGRMLDLEWRESDVPLDGSKPPRQGFGSELIEQALPYELGASTSIEFGRDGIRVTIQLALEDESAEQAGEGHGASNGAA